MAIDRHHLETVEKKIANLQELESALLEMLEHCSAEHEEMPHAASALCRLNGLIVGFTRVGMLEADAVNGVNTAAGARLDHDHLV